MCNSGKSRFRFNFDSGPMMFNSIPIPIPPQKILVRFQFLPLMLASIQFRFQFRHPWKSLKSDSNSNSGIGIAHHCPGSCEIVLDHFHIPLGWLQLCHPQTRDVTNSISSDFRRKVESHGGPHTNTMPYSVLVPIISRYPQETHKRWELIFCSPPVQRAHMHNFMSVSWPKFIFQWKCLRVYAPPARRKDGTDIITPASAAEVMLPVPSVGRGWGQRSPRSMSLYFSDGLTLTCIFSYCESTHFFSNVVPCSF